MTATSARSGTRSAIDAALILTIGMGFGRFAFTAVYPRMVEDGVLSIADGSLAASANYAGYLIGALLAMRAKAHSAHRLCLGSMLGTVACLALLGVANSAMPVLIIRFIAGIFSAMAMVAASLWLLEHKKFPSGAPLLFSGVGLGIVVSSELLALARHAGLHSHGLWLLLALASLVVGLMATPGLMAKGTATLGDVARTSARPHERALPLIIIYGLAGFGYIITATFLPLMVKAALPSVESAHVWAVFGLGAIPSCFVWHRLDQRLGTRMALMLNLALQAFGVVLPALLPSAASYLTSALLVGGTCMGTVTIALSAGQRLARRTGKNLVARLTVVFGIGQIIGPLLAGHWYQQSHQFGGALMAAAAALALGALISVTLLLERGTPPLNTAQNAG